jgi:16S rRNA (guanine527-N7)-methyltransferase
MDLIARGLAALDIDLPDRGNEKLRAYVREIETWNPAYGLVNASGDDLVVKHILDSLAPWKILSDLAGECDGPASDGRANIADIGSGAGLPGIPLSIALPNRRFSLVERMGKRVTFLQNEKALLSLDNVSIDEGEAERMGSPLQVVVFRAFRPFSETKLFSAIWSRLIPGGAIMAYKGKMINARIELAELSSGRLAGTTMGKAAAMAKVLPVWVPFLEEERCVVIMRKL